MNIKENSPFTPGSPVPVDLFVGRSDQIKDIIRYIGQIKNGRQENIFLAGDRGIGKSSLASFIRHFVNTQHNILGVHVFLGRVRTLEEMVRHIFDQVLKEMKGQKWFDEPAKLFGKYIKEVGLFGISVSFSPPPEDLQELVRNFPEAVYNLTTKLKKEKSGLFIALDDINGLVEKEEFANWYKSFADEVATRYRDFPVFFMLIGVPEKRDILSNLQPSLMRIFRVVEIEKLSNAEVKYFLDHAFARVEMKIKAEAIDLMVQYSSGLPLLMQEIGDAAFWSDEDGIIDQNDAYNAILIAAERIGKKYLDPKVYRAIRSPRYRSILRKIGELPILLQYFEKKELEKRLEESERKVFHNFLRRIQDLGVIEPDKERGPGAYKFVNELYPVYIWMESKTYQRKL